MLIALIVFIGLVFLIFVHEAGHFLAAKAFGMKVDEFGFGFPPRIKAWRPLDSARGIPGETEYSLNWLPFGGFVKIAGENDRLLGDITPLEALPEEEKQKFFFFQSAWRRSAVILAGVLMNFIFGWLLISSVFMIGTPSVALVVDNVQSGSPAEAAGLKAGDAISGFIKADDFIQFTNSNRGKLTQLEIIRGEEHIAIELTPRAKIQEGEGAIGVSISEMGIMKEAPHRALISGLKATGMIAKDTLSAFYALFKNLLLHGAILEGVVGPVGIFGVAQTAGSAGFIYLIQLLSLISINLAVINLLPFPALDGGRFLLIVVEKIKGSPLPKKFEAYANGIGFLLLVLLMIVITARDIGRLL
jgi:regulator of sigma E protease